MSSGNEMITHNRMSERSSRFVSLPRSQERTQRGQDFRDHDGLPKESPLEGPCLGRWGRIRGRSVFPPLASFDLLPTSNETLGCQTPVPNPNLGLRLRLWGFGWGVWFGGLVWGFGFGGLVWGFGLGIWLGDFRIWFLLVGYPRLPPFP